MFNLNWLSSKRRHSETELLSALHTCSGFSLRGSRLLKAAALGQSLSSYARSGLGGAAYPVGISWVAEAQHARLSWSFRSLHGLMMACNSSYQLEEVSTSSFQMLSWSYSLQQTWSSQCLGILSVLICDQMLQILFTYLKPKTVVTECCLQMAK